MENIDNMPQSPIEHLPWVRKYPVKNLSGTGVYFKKKIQKEEKSAVNVEQRTIGNCHKQKQLQTNFEIIDIEDAIKSMTA